MGAYVYNELGSGKPRETNTGAAINLLKRCIKKDWYTSPFKLEWGVTYGRNSHKEPH